MLETCFRHLNQELEEPVASLIWASRRMADDFKELSVVAEQLKAKYGKKFADSCRSNKLNNVNEKLVQKLSVVSAPPLLVEKYCEEIAKTYQVPFSPREIPDSEVTKKSTETELDVSQLCVGSDSGYASQSNESCQVYSSFQSTNLRLHSHEISFYNNYILCRVPLP